MDSTTSNNSNTSDTSHGTKEILKFLRPSPFKLARKSYFQGFSYLTSVFPIYPLLIKFGTFIILLQIYIPSMLLGITTLFPKDQLIYRVARTLSFFTHFFPIGTEIEYCENFVWIFAAISFENHILALISTIFFAKTSTIPKWLVGLSYISETTRKFFTVPAACSTAVNIIFQKNLSIYQIALFSIDIICLFFNFFEHVFFGFYSLFFLPISLSTYSQVSQNIINLSLIIFPLCSAILEFVSDNIKIIVVAIMLCFYLAFYLFFLLCGLVIDKTERIALNATNATAIVSTAVVFFLHHSGQVLPLYFPILVVSFWIIMYIAHYFFIQNECRRALAFLDQLQLDLELFEKIKTVKIVKFIIYGFSNSHEYCVTYSIFRDLIEQFPDNQYIIFCFAKFLAIFPDESAQLNWVLNKLRKISGTNKVSRYGISQIKILLNRRDTHLSKNLRHKLKSINRMVETSRLRVRNTWESLMNGTLTEIESACEIMISTIKKIENKFINIQNYHSNNQYSLRAQASFMKEVLADYDAYDDLLSKIKMIVSGRSLDADQPYLYGHYYFKNLPERIAKKTFQNHEILGGQTTSSFESIAITNQELKFPVEQRTLYSVIRNSIDKLTFPLIRTKIILHISYFIVFCFVPFLAYLFFYNDFIKYLKLPLDVLAHTSYFRDSFGTYTGCIVRYYFEEQNLIPDQCHNHDFGDEFFELQYPNIGGSCKSKQQIQYFSYRSMLALGFLNDYVKLDINNPKFIAGKSILMHNIYNFSYYSDTFSNETSFYNHFSTIQQKVVSLSESGLLLFENSTKHSINESELISTILINYYTINQYINIASEDFLEFSNHRVYKTLQFISILEITIPIFFVIAYGALTIIMTNLIRKLKLKLFCSSQALPKNVLQTMINKLDTSLLNGSSNTLTHTTGFIRQAEEETPENKNKFIHAMSLFRTGERSRKTTNLKVMIFLSISMLVLLISEFIFAAEHFQYIGETYLQFSPYTHLLSIAYSYSLQAMIYLNVYIHYNSFFEKIGLNRSQVFLQYHESRDISLHHFYDFLERNQTDFFGALFHAEVEDPTTEIPPDSRSMENSILKLNASQIQISNHKYSKNAKLQNLSKNKNIASKLNETELHDIFKELPLVQMYYLFVEIMDVVSHTKCNHSQDATFLLDNESYSPEIVEYLISELWHLQLFHLYSNYLDPLLSQIYYKSDTVLSQHKFVLYIVTIFFTIMEVIVLIFLVDRLNAITYKVRISLRLLLHAPPDVVLSSSYISSILSGDFKSLYKSKTAELDKNLYSLAAKHFPCAFLSVNKSGEIFKKNKLATDIFGDILFLPFEFSTNENDITVVEYHEKHFNVVTMKDIEDHNQFVLVFQDITDEFTMKNRIKEEKIKLENLINLFLPTELMEIYKFGKSVSLLIPQTTIISIAVHEDSYDRSFKSLQNPEIDEAANTNYYNNNNNNHYKVDTQQNNFTRIPPCLTSGSLSPISNHLINDPQSRHISHTCSTNNISNILNINNASNQNNINSKNHLAQEEEEDIKEVCKSDNVFEQLLFMMNNLIDKFPNLTTVELVADRFYVFGNFQGKSNEASQIAKEIIEFGLNVLMFAIQTNIKLQIGVVSGGPLSIGVIGKDMPHFEFIGDIIDFANRICTNASENLIHLARSTYELIYDGNFDIKVKNEEKSSTTTGNALIYTISL